jgi:hypothetical protein
MYKIITRETINNKWEFVLDEYNNEVEFDDLKIVFDKVYNLLDFYTRKDIKVITDIGFNINIVERKRGIFD